MGTRSRTPDLFSPTSGRGFSSSSTTSSSSAKSLNTSSRHILPTDLPKAIKHLSDQELDRLFEAVIAERKRRHGKLPTSEETPRKRKVEVNAPLTPGKLNAVRAAFKAGVTPSRIARQFGISQSDVRKALASHRSTR